MSRYKCSVCNECRLVIFVAMVTVNFLSIYRDPNGRHALITKTEAKEVSYYLLY